MKGSIRRNDCASVFIGEGKMKRAEQLLKHLVEDDSAQDLIEYALVAALIGLGSVASVGSLANAIMNTFNSVGSSLTNVIA